MLGSKKIRSLLGLSSQDDNTRRSGAHRQQSLRRMPVADSHRAAQHREDHQQARLCQLPATGNGVHRDRHRGDWRRGFLQELLPGNALCESKSDAEDRRGCLRSAGSEERYAICSQWDGKGLQKDRALVQVRQRPAAGVINSQIHEASLHRHPTRLGNDQTSLSLHSPRADVRIFAFRQMT